MKTPTTSASWRRIQLFAMDVDGVLTDGRIYLGADGESFKAFATLDGHEVDNAAASARAASAWTRSPIRAWPRTSRR